MASVPLSDNEQSGLLDIVRKSRGSSLTGVIVSLLLVIVTGSLLGAATRQGTGQPDAITGAGSPTRLVELMLLLIMTALVFWLVIGIAVRSTGLVRRKNALKMILAHFITTFVAMVGFFFLGFALQSGGLGALPGVGALGNLGQLNNEIALQIGDTSWGLLGGQGFTLAGSAYDATIGLLFLFQASIMVVAVLIPIGAMAERFRLSTALVYALFASALLYPIYANWTWGGGWLAHLDAIGLGAGYVDFGGSGVIHAIGGWAALAGIIVLRPRIRKFNMDETPNVIPPHNLVYVMMGTFMCLLGWFGVVSGVVLTQRDALAPRLGLAVISIMLAGTGGTIAATLYSWLIKRPDTSSIPTKGLPDASMAANGLLAGLVAGSAACLCISPISGLIIGAVAGVLVPIAFSVFEERLLVDDAVGAVTIHGVCGLWGQLAVGIFADGTLTLGSHTIRGLLVGDVSQLGAQLIGAVAALVWGFGGAYVFFKLLNRVMRLRVSSRVEMHVQGMDVLEVGAPAYSTQRDPVHGKWPRIAEGVRAYRMDSDAD